MRRRDLMAAAAGLPLAAGEALAQNRPAQPPAGRQQPRQPAPPPSTPATSPLGPVDTLARQAVMIDFDTGATLLEKNADERMPPSSMSKLMTMYVVFDMLKAGRLQLDQLLPVSERAWRMGGSKMFVQIGAPVSVENLARGVIVQSGNDACIVPRRGHQRVGGAVRRADERDRAAHRPAQQQLPQLDRLARPEHR
jgi:D-alanyl-D-alanine carboxypeptidase (penicillin-binding protein 5/6)